MFFETTFANKIRYAYARSPALAKLFEERATVDAVIRALGVPIATGHRGKLSDREAAAALQAHVAHLSSLRTSPWHGLNQAEIAAAGLFRSALPARDKERAFARVKKESELAAPVAKYMRQFEFEVYGEVPVGRNRADLVGYKESFFAGPHVAIVELKNAMADFKRGSDQLSTYSGYANEVWVACTPWLAASFLNDHAGGKAVHAWDPQWLEKKLKSIGCGLLLVEGTEVSRVLEPRKRGIDGGQLREVKTALVGRKPLG